MRGWLRRLRGALGMGLTWALGWAPIGAVVGAVLHVLLPGAPIGLAPVVVLNAVTFSVLGFIGGTVFAASLRLVQGRRRFDELSLPVFAVLGGAGGLLLGGLAVATGLWGAGIGVLGAGMVVAAAGLGAVSAAGSLAIARQADRIGPGADLDDEIAGVGLSDEERRRLLGAGS